METISLQLLVFGALAALANVLGGLILFPSKVHTKYKNSIKYLLAIGAGFMLGVTFIEILPKTILIWQQSQTESSETLYIPMLLLLLGYLITQFFEHTIAPHFHLGEEVHADALIPPSTAYSGIGGMLIHTFFDGIAIAAASQIDLKVGLLVFLAVSLHKFPEGFTVGSMLVAAGKGFREVLIATSILGATTLLGILFFSIIGGSLGFSVAYALPLASGVTLYVAASDLIPEVNHHGGRRTLVSFSVFAGVALFFLLHMAVHEFFEH